MTQMKPRTPKGFRDFLPAQMLKREYVFGVVRDVFHLYGFEPLQTPTLELRETLFGKYGEDAENLIFEAQHMRSDKDPYAMRYDLTVPLARVVAQYENDLKFPFKRYHMAPVWRGERPQRGRYREFYQCDADIVGVGSMSADAELIALTITALQRLGFPQFTMKINNRKLLTAMGVYSGVPDHQLPDLYRSVDKFDKVGADGVRKELEERGIAADIVARMIDFITANQGSIDADLAYLQRVMGNIEAAQQGIREMQQLAHYLALQSVPTQHYQFDYTTVRGLGYYTGPIWETVITEPNLGSINGGGRYDNLIGIFRKESLPTSGTSLGIERIIDVMEELSLYPSHIGGTVVQVLVTVFGEDTLDESTRLVADLRRQNVRAELYMTDSKYKLGNQFNHADKKGIPLVVVLGTDEIANGVAKIKRLSDGEEVTVARDEVAKMVGEMVG
jgi:histidyl-tRNA synthetase